MGDGEARNPDAIRAADYDRQYAATPAVFGDASDALLTEHRHRIPPDRPVLDLGCGQGRHVWALARMGFEVVAVDPSAVAVETVARVARDESLPVRTRCCGFTELEVADGELAAVLLFGLVQLLRWDEIQRLVRRTHRWLAPGGLAFVTAFSTDDASCADRRERWRTVGQNSFTDKNGGVSTYLEPGQLPRLFERFETIHHAEFLGTRHRHGHGPAHQHARVEGVFRRPEGA